METAFKEYRKIMSKTLGELMVGCEFNPPGSLKVDDIQQKTAKIINELDKMKGDGVKIAMVQSAYQQAAELAKNLKL